MIQALHVIERIVSKLGHPDMAIAAANSLLSNQQITGYNQADIGRNCELRGRLDLGEKSKISGECVLRGDIKIGKRSRIGPHTELIGEVNIGKYCAIARDVTFQQLNHQMHKPSIQRRFYEEVLDSVLEHVSEPPITVGHDVWIGTKAIILSGVSIGNGAVIGAGSIVTDDVEPYAVVAGTPAERVKWRFPEEVRHELQELAWWDWDDETLRRNRAFFDREIESVSDIAQALND
jgi:virginiamycin A acetyltransferase